MFGNSILFYHRNTTGLFILLTSTFNFFQLKKLKLKVRYTVEILLG